MVCISSSAHPEEAAIDVDPTRPVELENTSVHPVVLHTMSWSAEFGVASVAPATGAVLRLLAASTRARSVVEVGTGLGVSGLWLLQGLDSDAALTSIDVDPDLQAMARQSFAAAGFAANRIRLITGRAGTVLPRLADGAYDIVFVDVDPDEHPLCTVAAHRLLRDNGLLVLHQPMGDGTQSVGGPEWSAARLGPDLLAATKTAALPLVHRD
jgi:predicted O-methyltransferase YrrM